MKFCAVAPPWAIVVAIVVIVVVVVEKEKHGDRYFPFKPDGITRSFARWHVHRKTLNKIVPSNKKTVEYLKNKQIEPPQFRPRLNIHERICICIYIYIKETRIFVARRTRLAFQYARSDKIMPLNVPSLFFPLPFFLINILSQRINLSTQRENWRKFISTRMKVIYIARSQTVFLFLRLYFLLSSDGQRNR